ncbi:MAG TPA: M50 family metallopeptidase [Patescibacteria group bacterium]|nr:M50 family metallopeptidase [Patescibacteria group bacterium]
MILLILAFILFIGLIVVHEFGHFIVARRNGVEVEEFGIFFPPTLWRKKMKGGYDFTINALPLGGFVKLKGEHDSDTQKGSFGAAKLPAKIKIMLAGVGMNLLAAYLLFALVAVAGMPKLVENQFTVARDTKVIRQQLLIGYVEKDSPAEKAGLRVRDEIVAIGPLGETDPVESANNLPNLTRRFAGQNVQLTFSRSGQMRAANLKLRTTQEVDAAKNTDNPKGYLGISPAEFVLRRSTWSAPIVAAGLIKQFTILTLRGLWGVVSNLFHGQAQQASEQVSGPVGIFVILKDGSLLGYQFILVILAVISLTLAIMNALPIPALDGGRLFVTLLSRTMKRPLKPVTEEWIHGTGLIVLLGLFVLITIVDVRRFF